MAIKKELKPQILQMCKESKQVVNALAYEWAKTSNTIKNWLDKNSAELTRNESLKVISDELGISKTDLLC